LTLLPPIPTFFPYTTLFRSARTVGDYQVKLAVLVEVPCCHIVGRVEAGIVYRWSETPIRRSHKLAGQYAGGTQECENNPADDSRSEEHTSELQSRVDLVCRL